MYLSQVINVNLTDENSELLSRPSKVFNRIKALFSGDMTPTEQLQAEVMLSVLQRLNIALRKAEFSNLVSIIANDTVLFEQGHNGDIDLEAGNIALVDGFDSGQFNSINELRLTVDGNRDNLRYLVHVQIKRQPKASETPVKVTAYGFINEFAKLADETEEQFGKRVKQLIEQQWGNAAQRQSKLDSLEQAFSLEVAALQSEIDALFPAKSEANPHKRMMRDSPLKSRHSSHQNRYDLSGAYFIYWYEGYGQWQQDSDIDDLNMELDDVQTWDYDSDTTVTADSSSWTDSASFSDSGSSCGSSCGGGCGGS